MQTKTPQRREDVRSDEEFHMILWLQDAVRHNLISNWEYEPKSFELFPPAVYLEEKKLKTKVKVVEKCLHRGASYTPDFKITLTKEGKRILLDAFKKSILVDHSGLCNDVWIDVKGVFNPNDQPRYFSVIQKAMYSASGIWVERITPFYMSKKKPKGLFYETFAPDKIRHMKRGGLNSRGRSCMNAEQFMEKVYPHWNPREDRP